MWCSVSEALYFVARLLEKVRISTATLTKKIFYREVFIIPKIYPKVFIKTINPKKNPITFKNFHDLGIKFPSLATLLMK